MPQSLTSMRWLAPLLALLLLSGCSDGEVRKKTSPPPQRPTPALRLLVLTDLAGNLEPCGCTSRPLGGVDRMAAAVAAARDDGVPTLLVHAGDFFYGPGPHSATTSLPPQEVLKAETVATVFGDMHLDAVTPGERDLSHGARRFMDQVDEARFPVLAAGASVPAAPARGDGAQPAARALEGGVVRRVGARKVGVVGVMFPDPATPWPQGFEGPTDPLAAAVAAVKKVRAEGAGLVVALVDGSRRDARDLARQARVDFVVMGGLEESEPAPPSPADDAMLLNAGDHGQGLLVVDVWPRGAGPWKDVGELGRKVARKRLEANVADLKTRIAAWEKDESVSAQDVATQRERLARLQSQLEALRHPAPLPASGNAIAARYEELPQTAARSKAITKLLDGYFRKVNETNQRIYADAMPPPVPDGGAAYVGSAKCGSCHKTEYAWWKGTAHGHAYATLVDGHKQFNLDCVGCHVTGYEKPGGSTVTHVAGLENVGCENCHGPGSLHAKDPTAPRKFIHTDAPRHICVGCHTKEHSDLFDYHAYRNVLIMPGHGLPARSGS